MELWGVFFGDQIGFGAETDTHPPLYLVLGSIYDVLVNSVLVDVIEVVRGFEYVSIEKPIEMNEKCTKGY